jgi:2-methylcitrate dehydratase PrpD
MPTVAEDFAAFVTDLVWDEVPANIQDSARDRVLDALSTAVASRNVNTTRAAVAAAQVLGGGLPGPATVLPTGGTAGLDNAALANGTAVHAILFEDINLGSADHPGAVIIPAALAAAEAKAQITGREADIEDLLSGVLVGYEVHLWLGRIAGDGIRARGLRTTSMFGTVGAAAAAASVLGLSHPETVSAIAFGANLSFGILEGFAHGTMEPYIQAGVAARNGLVAALLVRSGAAVAAEALEGGDGFLRGLADITGLEATPPRGPWAITGVTAKPYPISGGKIGSVDSALAVLEQGVVASEIDRVVVRLQPGIREFPGGDRKGPFTTMSMAQDSTQFCVAAALLGRPMSSLVTVMDRYDDPEVDALSQRIELVSDPGRGGVARVGVTLKGGGELVGEVDWTDQQIPTVASMAAKLSDLTAGYWPASQADAVVAVITGDPAVSIRELSRLLRS